MNKKLISMELKSSFGFFKKPDINSIGTSTIYLTYNLPPKPAILGLLGSIMGWKSMYFNYETGNSCLISPEDKFEKLKIGVKPIGNFPFEKIQNKTNTCMGEMGNTFFIEQLLLKPHYKIYLFGEVDLVDEILNKLKTRKFIFSPHFGRNEFPVTLESDELRELEFENTEEATTISTIYLTKNSNQSFSVQANNVETPDDLYEIYPLGFTDQIQYILGLAKYIKCERGEHAENIEDIDMEKGSLLKLKEGEIIYVF